MLFDSLDFKAMENSLSAAWTKQQVIAQNLANVDTPGYKAKEVSFENVLDKAMLDRKDNRYAFRTTITEEQNTFINPDGNNVDVDKESMELYSTYYREGLPVGPICNPGLKAINAALHPADTHYVFFLTDKSGEHFYYASTIAEHNANGVKAGLF